MIYHFMHKQPGHGRWIMNSLFQNLIRIDRTLFITINQSQMLWLNRFIKVITNLGGVGFQTTLVIGLILNPATQEFGLKLGIVQLVVTLHHCCYRCRFFPRLEFSLSRNSSLNRLFPYLYRSPLSAGRHRRRYTRSRIGLGSAIIPDIGS